MRTVADLDREIARWDSDLQHAMTNMLAMKKMSAYRLLFESEPPIKLEGMTKARFEPIRREFKDLWAHFSLVQSAIDSARKVRAREKKPSRMTIDAAFFILEGGSIDIPVSVKPLQQRGLLTSVLSTNKMSPSDLMAAMSRSYEAASQICFEVSSIWETLDGELAEMKAEADALRAHATELGTKVVELTQFDRKADEYAGAANLDPLGAGGSVRRELRPLLDAVQKALSLLQTQKDQLLKQKDLFSGLLTAAKASLPQLDALNKECEALYLEASDAIAGLKVHARSQFSVERLRVWLRKVEAEALKNPIAAFPKFNNWKRVVDEFRTLEETAKNGYAGLIEQREELKVRMRMYKQTAGRQIHAGRCMVEDPELLRVKGEVEQALARPCDLEVARRLVAEYHSRLRAMERANKLDGQGSLS